MPRSPKSILAKLADPSGHECLIIGEVGLAHDGSLGTAHAMIDAIADTGADAVKFQTHIASAESTPAEPWRVKFSPQDETRYGYWERTAFSEPQWQGLSEHAQERGLIFLSSPFSAEAVDLLTRLGITAWKVASGEIGASPMLDQMIRSGLPLLLSTGMSPMDEIDRAVALVKQAGTGYAVFQCTTAYPCPAEQIGLNMLAEYRERYGCAVGLSDHSGTIYPGLAAASLGCDLIEVHVTLSRAMFGPDVPASLTIGELRQLVEGVRTIERIKSHPVDKNLLAGQMSQLRDVFKKSVVARIDVPAGTVLSDRQLAIKKPGTGIPACELGTLFGRRLRRALRADDQLQDTDLEPEC